MVFGLAAGGREGGTHALRQIRAEEGVVLDVDPQHRHARGAAEIRGRLDQFVGRAIVVGLALDSAARPAAKVMIAFTGGGFTLDRAMDAQPPADWPTTITSFGMMRFSAAM